MALEYEKGLLKSDKRRAGWAVTLPGGVLGPRALLATPDEAREGSATLTVDGRAVDLAEPPVAEVAGLVLRAFDHAAEDALQPRDVAFGPELQDCLVVVPSGGDLPISRARLRATEAGWALDDSLAERAWPSGALVLGRDVERYVGVLVDDDEGLRVVPFPAELW